MVDGSNLDGGKLHLKGEFYELPSSRQFDSFYLARRLRLTENRSSLLSPSVRG